MSIKQIAFTTIVVTYILIVFGGYVASSESGMGCGPDWPLCNGVLVPVLKGATLIEYTHRVIGAILAIFTGILSIKIFRGKDVTKRLHTTAIWMVGFLIIQILLGAVVVFLDTPAIIVSIHLLIAMLFLACVIFIWRSLDFHVVVQHNKWKQDVAVHKIKQHLNVLLLFIVLTIGLGAYIKHQSFGLACNWLNCGDTFLPINGPEILQSLHRFFATLTAIYIFFLSYKAYTKKWSKSLKRRIGVAVVIVLAQFIVGILTIITNLSLSLAVLHLALATLLFAFIVEARVFHGFSIIERTSVKGNSSQKHY